MEISCRAQVPLTSNVRRHEMSTSLWLGLLDDEVLVFDPTLQLPDCPHVFLWSESRGMQRFIPVILRTKIRTLRDGGQRETTIAAFETWKLREDIERWLGGQRNYYRKRRKKEVVEAGRRQAYAHQEMLSRANGKFSENSNELEDQRRRMEEDEYEARLQQENFSGRYGNSGSFNNAPSNYADDHPIDGAGPFPDDFYLNP